MAGFVGSVAASIVCVRKSSVVAEAGNERTGTGTGSELVITVVCPGPLLIQGFDDGPVRTVTGHDHVCILNDSGTAPISEKGISRVWVVSVVIQDRGIEGLCV